jgi:hypothetical protein
VGGCGSALPVAEAEGRDGGRRAAQDSSIRVDEVVSRLRVVPIARKAIEQALVHPGLITDVVCTSKLMYVSDGAVTHCTALVNDVASGWTLTFFDAAGTYRLVRTPGKPWQFATP